MKPFWKAKPSKTVEESLKYKIRVDPKDRSFSIDARTIVKKSLMVDFYKKTSMLTGAKKEYDDIGITSFLLPEKGLGVLHSNLKKFYSFVESDTCKDFEKNGKFFRITTISTKSCEFVKLDNDDFEIVIKTEGYWTNQ